MFIENPLSNRLEFLKGEVNPANKKLEKLFKTAHEVASPCDYKRLCTRFSCSKHKEKFHDAVQPYEDSAIAQISDSIEEALNEFVALKKALKIVTVREEIIGNQLHDVLQELEELEDLIGVLKFLKSDERYYEYKGDWTTKRVILREYQDDWDIDDPQKLGPLIEKQIAINERKLEEAREYAEKTYNRVISRLMKSIAEGKDLSAKQ